MARSTGKCQILTIIKKNKHLHLLIQENPICLQLLIQVKKSDLIIKLVTGIHTIEYYENRATDPTRIKKIKVTE